MTYIFEVFDPILCKSFIHRIRFQSDSDFRLYAYSMYSGNWRLVSKSK